MRGVLLFVPLTLLACTHREAVRPVAPPAFAIERADWRVASGKQPTKVEFAALLAACKTRDEDAAKRGVDRCLINLGLKRVP